MPLPGRARWWRDVGTSAPKTAGVAFAGGVVAALSLPPWGWWPLGVIGLAVAAWCLHGAAEDGTGSPPVSGAVPAPSSAARARNPWRRRALVGLGFGLGVFLPGLWWVTEFHAVGYVVLTLLQTSFFVVAFALCRAWWAFPGAVVLAEAARSAVPFGGLPLGGLALGQAGGPFVASARIGGGLLVLGIVAALASVAAAPRRRVTAAVPVALSLGIAASGWVAPAGSTLDREHEAALVQGGGQRGFRAVESDANEVFERHLRASRQVPSDGEVDLVLWPENAIDVPLLEGSAVADELAALAQRTGATVVAGVTEDADADRFVNAAVVWSSTGDVIGRYEKVHRVPFGEYVPGRAFFEKLVDLSVLPRDAVAGRGNGVVRTAPIGRIAVAISYEVFFSDRTRSGVRGGGVVVLVPTNAASFTTSQVPGQEVAAARLRAWETGRWVLQAAPTGYTAVIDHRGRVLQRSTLGRAEIVRAAIERRAGFTWYVRYGDAPVVVAALVLVALASRLRVRVFRR